MAAAPPPVRPPLTPVHEACPPAPTAVPIEAADEAEMPLPANPQTFFLGGLFVLGVLAALYVASSLL